MNDPDNLIEISGYVVGITLQVSFVMMPGIFIDDSQFCRTTVHTVRQYADTFSFQ